MVRRVAVAALPAEDEPPMSNGCAQVEALREQTAALREQTLELRRLRITVKTGIREVKPVLVSVRTLCARVKKWGIPGALFVVGMVSPNAAEALKALLSQLGAG